MTHNHFQLVVIQRINEHKEKEAVRLEAERARIRVEEQVKVQREAEVTDRKRTSEEAGNQVETTAAELRVTQDLPVVVHLSAATQTVCHSEGAQHFAALHPNLVKLPVAMVQLPIVAMAGGAREFRLDQIGTRLGFSVSAEFLCQLGFDAAGRDLAAVLYNEHDFSRICTALVSHIGQVQAYFRQPNNGQCHAGPATAAPPPVHDQWRIAS